MSDANNFNELIVRFEALRKDLFAAIDYAIKQDGHHKSYEGTMAMYWPNRWDDGYTITLDCYVIGPSRHYHWGGKSFDLALNQAEKDIRMWIAEEYEHIYDS